MVTPIAIAAEDPGAGANGVRIGSTIKAVFVEIWLRGQDTSPGAEQLVFGKATAGSTGPNFSEMGNLQDYNEKNNVLFFHQGLSNVNTDAAVPVLRGWMKIPKGKQRMALGDRLYLAVAGLALDVNQCGQFTFKEYF